MHTLIRTPDFDPTNASRPEPESMGGSQLDFSRLLSAILAHRNVADRVRAALAYVSPRAVMYGRGYRRTVAEYYYGAVRATDGGNWSVAAHCAALALAHDGQLFGAVTWADADRVAGKILHGEE